jgi:hypothetical protein
MTLLMQECFGKKAQHVPNSARRKRLLIEFLIHRMMRTVVSEECVMNQIVCRWSSMIVFG